MRKSLTIAYNDLLIQLKDNSAWLNLFILPVVFIFIIGLVNGAFSENENGGPIIRMDVINDDRNAAGEPSDLSQNLLQNLRDGTDNLVLCPMDNTPDDVCQLADVATLDLETARQRAEDGPTQAVVQIPPAFEANVLAGENTNVTYIADEDLLQPSFLIQSLRAAAERSGASALASRVGLNIYNTLDTEADDAAEFQQSVYQAANAIWSEIPTTTIYRLSAENNATIEITTTTVSATFDTDRTLVLDVVDNDDSEQSDVLIDRLDRVDRVLCPMAGESACEGAAEAITADTTRLDAGTAAAVLVIPSGFGEAIANGETITLELTQADNVDLAGSIAQTAQTVAPETETEAAGFRQSVPGMGSMYVMFTVLAGATLIIQERQYWTLQRLATAPVSRAQILGGKMLGRFAMGMIQFGVAFGFGLILGVDLGDSLLGIVLIMIAFTLCMTAITFLLSTFFTREQQIASVTTFFVLVTAPLGGAWWPLEIVPDFMQTLALITPIGWAMEGFNELIFYGGVVVDVLVPVAVLLAATLVIFGIAVTRFEYE
jgi:ABC-type Na+ efflux pump permease subunit